jgi:hypothetical protein
MGVPPALPLAVFVFIGGFIPIVGSTAAGTLAVAVALLSNGPVSALIVLAVIVGVNQLEHHLLQPVLMGKVLSIHRLAILRPWPPVPSTRCRRGASGSPDHRSRLDGHQNGDRPGTRPCGCGFGHHRGFIPPDSRPCY